MKNENVALFNEMDKHLLEDERPSAYFQILYEKGKLDAFPFSLLKSLKETPQSPDHHPEGDVWVHTMMVVDEASKIKHESSAPGVFMWAALLHDIGKPSCTKYKNGRLTAYNHDIKGAELAATFLEQLSTDISFISRVSKLVRWHMQVLFVMKDNPQARIAEMKASVDVREVALLGRCDRLGRKGSNPFLVAENTKRFLKKLEGWNTF